MTASAKLRTQTRAGVFDSRRNGLRPALGSLPAGRAGSNTAQGGHTGDTGGRKTAGFLLRTWSTEKPPNRAGWRNPHRKKETRCVPENRGVERQFAVAAGVAAGVAAAEREFGRRTGRGTDRCRGPNRGWRKPMWSGDWRRDMDPRGGRRSCSHPPYAHHCGPGAENLPGFESGSTPEP
jgi:hypothetical protein